MKLIALASLTALLVAVATSADEPTAQPAVAAMTAEYWAKVKCRL